MSRKVGKDSAGWYGSNDCPGGASAEAEVAARLRIGTFPSGEDLSSLRLTLPADEDSVLLASP